MSNYDWIKVREREKQLFIVEGNHEKNKMFQLLLRCFPEININLDDIIIYGTNIYQLYSDIDTAYPDGWSDQDVDLPKIVSKKKEIDTLFKEDFTNILLVFDYERHDPNFSEEKILEMVSYFQDAADVGQLYLNYPMVESYQDFNGIPDSNFINKQISVTVNPGYQYKNMVKDLHIAKLVGIPQKIEEILTERFQFNDSEQCKICVDKILYSNNDESIKDEIESILSGHLGSTDLETAKNQIAHTLSKYYTNDTFYRYMRNCFTYIIYQNIIKANKIQSSSYSIPTDIVKEDYTDLSLREVLLKQNDLSRDIVNGHIWVLSTSILFVPEWNFSLIKSE